MDIFTTATSAYLALQSLPLLFSPSILISLTATEPHLPTNLETYLSRTLGLTLLALAALILLSNNLPTSVLAPPQTENDASSSSDSSHNPLAQPTLVIATIYHALTAFYLYAQLTYMYTWNFAFTCGLLGSGALFCLGVWTLLFGNEGKSFSRRTGADKRTSGFPFANKESAMAQRKEAKEKEKERRKRI